MRTLFLSSLAVVLAGAGLSLAEAPPAPETIVPAGSIVGSVPDGSGTPVTDDAPARGRRLRVDSEYLLWWFKRSPVPVPLLTSAALADANPGALGQPGTQVLLGGTDVDTQEHSGGRFTIGYGLHDDQTCGVEASYFFLPEKRATQVVSSSGQPGSPIIGVPFFDVNLPGESFLPTAVPGVGPASHTLTISERLHGGEVNGLARLPSGDGLRLDLLAGFRYVQLTEDLHLASTLVRPDGSPQNAIVVSVDDEFHTRNRFWGGQVGARAAYCAGHLSVRGTAKLALGDMHEAVDIGGATLLANFATTVPFPGGFFALPTNSGHHAGDRFAVVPELGVSVGYDVTGWAQVFAGYNFLYLSDVARPGDQIDHNINLTQVPALSAGAGTLTGPAAPLFPGRSTDFWAQGINLGLEIRY
jgi:hypothetical protein